MHRDRYAQRIKEIAGWVEPTLKETPRQFSMRVHPELMPTRQQVQRARRIALGSPGAKEWLDEALAWSTRNWKWLLGGGALYTVLLIACSRRAK